MVSLFRLSIMLCLCATAFTACHKKASQNPVHNSIEWVKVKELNISKEHLYVNPQIWTQYSRVIIDAKTNKKFWVTQHCKTEKGRTPNSYWICIRDYETYEVIKTITLGTVRHPKSVMLFDYINKDSAIVAMYDDDGITPSMSDSLFALTDSTGNVIRYFPLEGENFWGTHQSRAGKLSYDKYYVLTNTKLLGSRGELYRNGKICFPLKPYWGLTNDARYKDKPIEVAGCLDITKNPPRYEPVYIQLPAYAYKNQYPFDPASSKCIFSLSGKELIIHFGYNPYIYKYNLSTKKYKTYYIKSNLIDTILPRQDIVPGAQPRSKQYDNTQAEYMSMIADTFNHWYYRVFRLPPPPNATPKEINSPQYGIMLLDSAFNVLGEGICPKELNPMTIRFPKPTPDGLALSGLTTVGPTKDNWAGYTIYQPKFIPQNPRTLLNELYPDYANRKPVPTGWLAYFHALNLYQQKTKTKRQAFIFVPAEKSCVPCKQRFYKSSIEVAEKTGTKVIVAFTNQKSFEEDMKAYPELANNPVVTIDTSGKYLKYLVIEVNPRAVFIENDKVIKTLAMDPGTVTDVTQAVQVFLLPKGKAKKE